MILDCVVETLVKNPVDSLRYYLPMIPIQTLFLIGCSHHSLCFLGNFGLYNLMFQIFLHLQYMLLLIIDLTGVTLDQARFPGFEHMLVTIPFALYHLM